MYKKIKQYSNFAVLLLIMYFSFLDTKNQLQKTSEEFWAFAYYNFH